MGRTTVDPRTARRRAWIAALVVAVLTLGGGAAGLRAMGGDAAPDATTVTSAALADRGESDEVIDCVVRLGRDDLRVGPLDGAALEELVSGCRLARAGIAAEGAPEPVEPVAPAGPMTRGDDPGLDALWAGCEAGVGADCDRLFDEAPAGSDYETYGLTCGERPDILHCSELDVVPADDEG